VHVLLHCLAKEEVRKEPQGDHAGGAAPDRDGIDDLGGGHEDVGDVEVLVEASARREGGVSLGDPHHDEVPRGLHQIPVLSGDLQVLPEVIHNEIGEEDVVVDDDAQDPYLPAVNDGHPGEDQPSLGDRHLGPLGREGGSLVLHKDEIGFDGDEVAPTGKIWWGGVIGTRTTGNVVGFA